MDIYLTNTLTRAKERFVPADPGRVTMYVCGPTVYNYAHIGNARPPVVFDVLFRLLRAAYGEGSVVYARNFTDIDDRIIARAAELNEPIETLTARYTKIYRDDMAALGNLAPSLEPTATGHVPQMCEIIGALIDKGAAYKGKSGVWFCVAEDADYGKLSRRTQDEMLTGTRVEAEDDKKHPSDFALWKTAKPGEPAWDSDFGRGRPGWHIECSAMIRANLGETIDIHGGGIDLIFPHHENEIAQSETAYGKPLARYWMHNGFLDMDGEKMSKSLGNVVLIHELASEWPGEVLRWALLSAHYRAPLGFSRDLLEQSKASLDRLYTALRRLKDVDADDVDAPDAFVAALCDDLNTPEAVAVLFGLATEANKSEKLPEQQALKGRMLAAGALIGVLQGDPEAWFRSGDNVDEIDVLVAERVAARQAKDWAEADRLRQVLAGMGVEVMDNPQGSTWKRVG
ncbi:MAG: cysteine--tRNA ligase [Hyphomonadaceae bacterium]|nr:MAG: cysteinyl-tRNA synthetase [Caulobacteraceae bacterium]MBT9447058.1 cysteine--tRNA ligase [Hyphomonadaceae bacterium]TPW04993.1 MAG: cysteinyl-tRNA synthetase [Alphaproteobacteria bacterium]